MTPLCPACAAGPAQVEGHARLKATSLGESGMAFTCADCGALWGRDYSTTGHFRWRQSASTKRDDGVSLPLTAAPGAPVQPARMNSTPGAADHWLAVQLSWKRPKRRG